MSFKTKFHMKAYERIGMKTDTNELNHMTKIAAMHKYVTFKNILLQNHLFDRLEI